MMHAHCMKTVMGGLSLVLLLSACSSGAKSRKADTTTQARSNVSTSHDPTDRMTAPQASATERPVPSDRLGTGDSRTAGQTSDRLSTGGTADDRVVPCADDKGDMTASLDCDKMNRTHQGDRTATLSDRSPEIAAACASRVDARGTLSLTIRPVRIAIDVRSAAATTMKDLPPPVRHTSMKKGRSYTRIPPAQRVIAAKWAVAMRTSAGHRRARFTIGMQIKR